VQRECVYIKSRSVPIRTEPSRVAEIVCSQEEGHIALVLEKKTIDGILWFRFACGWMCAKDSNGFDCYEMTNEVRAQKFWAKEFDNRRRLSAAVGNILARTHGLMNARRTARQIRENAVIYRDRKKPLLNLPNVSMENMMVALQAASRLKGPEIFEFIRIAASHQSDPHKAIVEIATDTENMLLKRPSEWVKEDMGVINTVDSRSKNDLFIMAAARDDVPAFERCLANGQELAALHSDLQYTALHAAADFGAARVVKMLIQTGISVNLRDAKRGMTALHFAAQSGRTAICELLIEHGADRTMSSYEGKLPYEIADYQGHFECREKLKHVPTEVSEVMLVESTSTSLTIEWPVPEQHPKFQAEIIDYGVMHEPSDSKRCGYGQIYTVTTNKFTITGIPPATGHGFRVYARSVAGMSTPSSKVINFTLPDVPEKMPQMELLKVAKNGLYLNWHPPAYENGSKVTLYQLEMRSAIEGEDLHEDGTLKTLEEMGIPDKAMHTSSIIDDEDDDASLASKALSAAMDEEAVEDADRRYKIMLHRKVHRRHRFVIGLEQDRPYRFRIRCINEIGWAPWSDYTSTFVPADGVKVTEFGDDFAALEWFTPVLTGGRRTTGFELQMTVPKGPLEATIEAFKNKDAKKIKIPGVTEDESTISGASYDFRTLDNMITEPRFTVNNLMPGFRYQFRVRSRIMDTFTDWDLGFVSQIITMPAAPPDVCAGLKVASVMGGMGTSSDGTPTERLDVDHDSVMLTWHPGNPNGSAVQEVQVMGAKIRDYRPEDLESAQMAATPSKGGSTMGNVGSPGRMSEQLSSLAIDGVSGGMPGAPSASLSMGNTASSVGTLATGMTDLTWHDMSASGKQFGPQKYRIMKLTSGATYIFKIRAKNDCGWSEFSTASEMVTTMLVGPPRAPHPYSISAYFVVLRWNPALDNQFNFTALELEFESTILPSPSAKDDELNNAMSLLVWTRCSVSKWVPDPLSDETLPADDPTEDNGGVGGYVMVDGLQPNAPYVVRMRIRTVVGWSSWSLTSDVIQTPGPS